ncbi:SH3 domain-containing protein [Paraglaciecola sp. L3A3]|uniref:SH3 domain-containing protein n=1 Tax=Paraglaciecola sp. L3A3 TaxID=2686358 RepID=UPI00131B1927|nr:SH3 domain-containing protein [Paraglaciecola sp. L3A3]
MLRVFLHLSLMAFTLLSSQVRADTAEVQISQAFVNVHTGPASGYPVFQVIERGEWVTVLKRRTNWFKVMLGNKQQGWITQADLNQTKNITGEKTQIKEGSLANFAERDIELAIFAGTFDSVNGLSFAGSWVWTENIATELSYTQALGDFSKNELLMLRIQHSMFPEWRLSPYLSLGAGLVRTTPKASLVQSGDEVRNSDALELGLGARYYLNRNFIIRLEYKNLLVITDRDEQQELNQWNLGFAVFF